MSDTPFPTGDLMKGKRGLIMGVANKNSIAWAIAQQLATVLSEETDAVMTEAAAEAQISKNRGVNSTFAKRLCAQLSPEESDIKKTLEENFTAEKKENE